MKLKAFTLTFLLFFLVINVGFCFAGQTSNTIFGLSNGTYLNHLDFRNGYSGTFLNDYVYSSAYQSASSNVSYPDMWFVDGYGISANANLQLNTWFQSGVLNFTSNNAGTAKVYGPNSPTYMLGGAYDLSSGFNSASGVWSLLVSNGATYTAAFTRYWGNFYITRVDSSITGLGWTGQALTISTQGAGGIFSVYTGSRNAPQTITGLTSTSYNQATLVLTGTYGANAQIILDWTAAPGNTGGNPTATPTSTASTAPTATPFGATPTPTPHATPNPTPAGYLSLGSLVNLGVCQANSSVDEALNVTFAGSQLAINSITFSGDANSWMASAQVYPYTFTMGSAQISYVLTVPSDALSGVHSGSVVVSGVDPFGNVVSASSPYTLTVLDGSSSVFYGINPMLIYIIIGAIAVIVVAVLISKLHRR